MSIAIRTVEVQTGVVTDTVLTEAEAIAAGHIVPPTNEDVNRERDARLAAGATFTPTGHATPVAVNIADEPNLNGLATLAVVQTGLGNGSTTVQWRDNADVVHTLTYDQIIELYGLAAAYKQAVFAASWNLKDAPGGIPSDYQDDAYWP